MVLNINSSQSTILVSVKQFISFSVYIISFLKAFQGLKFTLRSSFIRVNVSNSIKKSEYYSSEMKSSDNAFEMRLLIVLSAEAANISIV